MPADLPTLQRSPMPRQRLSSTDVTEYLAEFVVQSGLAPVNLTTLPHFSVSSARSLPKSAGESASGALPRSASRALILGSARAALTSVLSLSPMPRRSACCAGKAHARTLSAPASPLPHLAYP